jgi:beta-1,4-mannosyltransferase
VNLKRKNPPSIPTLGLIRLVAWLRGCKVIIDWHNLGYTLLAMKLGSDNLLVKIAKT